MDIFEGSLREGKKLKVLEQRNKVFVLKELFYLEIEKYYDFQVLRFLVLVVFCRQKGIYFKFFKNLVFYIFSFRIGF